jgi:hypothetical protein
MPTRRWAVIRVDDSTQRGAFESKAEALAAASRFSADGCAYEVLEQLVPDAGANSLRQIDES